MPTARKSAKSAAGLRKSSRKASVPIPSAEVPALEKVRKMNKVESWTLKSTKTKEEATVRHGSLVSVLPPDISRDDVKDSYMLYKFRIGSVYRTTGGGGKVYCTGTWMLRPEDVVAADVAKGFTSYTSNMGVAELALSTTVSVIDAESIDDDWPLAHFNDLLIDGDTIPGTSWYARYLWNDKDRKLHRLKAQGGPSTWDKPIAEELIKTCTCDVPVYNPNLQDDWQIACPNCEAWFHMRCIEVKEGTAGERYSPGRQVWENMLRAPITRGAYYNTEADPPEYRDDWMLAGSGSQVTAFKELIAELQEPTDEQLTDEEVLARPAAQEPFFADYPELEIDYYTCPDCGIDI